MNQFGDFEKFKSNRFMFLSASLDADSIAHSVYSPGSQAVRDIVAEFGSHILQPNVDEIDRKKLGSIVFADRSAMAVSSFQT
jgi:dephospho-CoA kinase